MKTPVVLGDGLDVTDVQWSDVGIINLQFTATYAGPLLGGSCRYTAFDAAGNELWSGAADDLSRGLATRVTIPFSGVIAPQVSKVVLRVG
jgi:hypothetical protein